MLYKCNNKSEESIAKPAELFKDLSNLLNKRVRYYVPSIDFIGLATIKDVGDDYFTMQRDKFNYDPIHYGELDGVEIFKKDIFKSKTFDEINTVQLSKLIGDDLFYTRIETSKDDPFLTQFRNPVLGLFTATYPKGLVMYIGFQIEILD